MKRKICITVITVLLIFAGGCKAAQAITSIELEQKRAELKEKISQAGKNIENINVEVTKNLETITNLDQEIGGYEEQIQSVSESLNKIEKQIKQTENTLETIQERYDKQQELLKTRLVYMFESGETRYLDVLLNATSIVDFITRYYYITEIAQYDRDFLDTIQKEKDQIEAVKDNLKISKENLKTIKAQQKKMEISLENAKVERNSYINNLSTEEKKLKNEIDLYQQELDLVELEILMTALDGTDGRYVGGIFAWPAPGYYSITSPYGMRIHPVLKKYANHSGMDIGAPMGSYAIAANDGIVTKSTYSYSYGNMVMIDHGGGVSTLYAHGSELIAQVGDVVKRGDPVLKVGSTGWSTGPHLHFEIRINGKTVDPYQYVISNTSLNVGE